jgi:hypothetical protein
MLPLAPPLSFAAQLPIPRSLGQWATSRLKRRTLPTNVKDALRRPGRPGLAISILSEYLEAHRRQERRQEEVSEGLGLPLTDAPVIDSAARRGPLALARRGSWGGEVPAGQPLLPSGPVSGDPEDLANEVGVVLDRTARRNRASVSPAPP